LYKLIKKNNGKEKGNTNNIGRFYTNNTTGKERNAGSTGKATKQSA
jgi:hypothetical protein